MGFENVAFSDKAGVLNGKSLITCLTSCVNKSGRAPLTLNSDGLLSLLCISKFNADHGACVPPRRKFDAENE